MFHHHYGAHFRHNLRDTAILARIADRSPYPPPRLAVLLAKIAGWSAIGAVAVVALIPVLAILDALAH